jgi:hypothetical protein
MVQTSGVQTQNPAIWQGLLYNMKTGLFCSRILSSRLVYENFASVDQFVFAPVSTVTEV